MPVGYNPFIDPSPISVMGMWDCDAMKDRCSGVKPSISLRSRWVLSPVWSHSRPSWTARVLGAPSVERPRTKTSGRFWHMAESESTTVSICLLSLTHTYSSSPCGTRMFISELLALTMSQLRESLLRYTWQPSVLLMEMVGTLPSTYSWTFDWQRCMYVAEFALIKCKCHLQTDSAQIYHNMCHTKPKHAELRCSESFSIIFLTCSWTAFELMISTIPTTFSNTKPSFLQLSERWKYTY